MLNNYTPEEVETLKNSEAFSYLLFGKEHAPKTGTPHLQGYFEMTKKRGPNGLAKSIPGLERASLRVARGTAKQNRVYSGKEDKNPFEKGVPQQQGLRADLMEVKARIDDGETDEELWTECLPTMVRFHKAFAVYKKIKSAKRDWVTNVILFVGPTDTHKSHLAHILGNSGAFGTFYVVPTTKGSGLYFDGYDEHDCILIDEMDGNRCTPTFLNGLCDRYEFSVPVHGNGNVAFLARTIIICSNYMPKDWWHRGHNIDPFMRRISIAQFRGRDGGGAPLRRRRPTMLRASVRAYEFSVDMGPEEPMSLSKYQRIYGGKGKEEECDSE